MSYDLAVWDGEQPLDDGAAGLVFDELYERYLESEEAAVPLLPRIDASASTLIERYPEDGRDSPWASPPVIDEASGPIPYLLMSYVRAEEVSGYAASLARVAPGLLRAVCAGIPPNCAAHGVPSRKHDFGVCASTR
ncbi:hypothetical protein ACFVTC_20810 [Streptomyces sp. NPDC057950]|uniref:hypothetical protein n=1 Tax=Streptomyces sp. NPDC057950 TaxID=3346288 RepID=UPI0036E8DE70